jgi:hypothetical protein
MSLVVSIDVILLLFAYTGVVPSRSCVVSFTDADGVEHSVRVSAASLYEAAVLALAEFRRHGFCGYHFWTGHEADGEDPCRHL